MFVVALAFAFAAFAFAAEKPSVVPFHSQQTKAAPIKAPKETRVSLTGIVRDISETIIRVERTIKGNVETMEFTLEKPVETIKVGDKVKVSYVKKEGKNIAIRVAPVVAQKLIKKAVPAKEIKKSPPIVPAPSNK
jgi:hypothetical protein